GTIPALFRPLDLGQPAAVSDRKRSPLPDVGSDLRGRQWKTGGSIISGKRITRSSGRTKPSLRATSRVGLISCGRGGICSSGASLARGRATTIIRKRHLECVQPELTLRTTSAPCAQAQGVSDFRGHDGGIALSIRQEPRDGQLRGLSKDAGAFLIANRPQPSANLLR